jgi:hypothetical protein
MPAFSPSKAMHDIHPRGRLLARDTHSKGETLDIAALL